VVAVSSDDHFFHASLTQTALVQHARADAAAWARAPRPPSRVRLDLYDATGRVLVPTAGQAWLLSDVRATDEVVAAEALLARLTKVAKYVEQRAPEAVDVPVPRSGESLRAYLRRLAYELADTGPAVQPLSGEVTPAPGSGDAPAAGEVRAEVPAAEAATDEAGTGDAAARHQRGSLHNLLHAIFG
jgi:hypothetical protein